MVSDTWGPTRKEKQQPQQSYKNTIQSKIQAKDSKGLQKSTRLEDTLPV